jgi:hypothetical protein
MKHCLTRPTRPGPSGPLLCDPPTQVPTQARRSRSGRGLVGSGRGYFGPLLCPVILNFHFSTEDSQRHD